MHLENDSKLGGTKQHRVKKNRHVKAENVDQNTAKISAISDIINAVIQAVNANKPFNIIQVGFLTLCFIT